MTRSQIIIQQQLFLSYLPHVRAQFGMLPGVAVIGLGAKERNGEILDEWAFRFYVHQKLPLHEIPAAERIPDQIFGIQTDVISYFEKESLICDASVLSIDTNGYRDEGIRGGISIRNDHFDNDQPSGYGTLGVLARRKSDNALVGLTCAHVVNAASQNLTEINTKIGQPKYWVTCCCCPHGYIGDVAKATFNTDLDCAVIAIHDDIEEHVTANHTENKIEGLANDITGAAAIVCFDTVTKRGRATGLTAGKISEIAYGNNQMLIERTGGNAGDPFACHGDSGAVVVNSSGQVVGLVVAAARANMKRTIVTHIKPVMQELDITIAGTDASTIGEPLGGGPTGCELLIWPGGQADTAMNPVEKFSSSDFGLTGPVAWDVSTGAPGAVITETGTQQATNLESISVRYDRVSATKNATDTVYIQAKGTDTVTKFRTIFCFTPRAINTANPLDSNNSKLFPLTGGTQNLAGIATPVDAGDWFMAKAEIIYDINPQNIQWSGGNSVSFVTGALGGLQGNIVARRETKFTKGEQANGAANRTHTDQATYVTAGESSTDDFQPPTDALPNNLFRLAHEGFDPTNLLQDYLRGDFRDYLEFHDGTNWVRITSYTEWFANLTGGLNTAPPPTATDPNTIGAGANTEKIPNQKPTVVPVETFREIKPGEVLTMNVTVTDADNDEVTVTWAQTAGPAATLSSTTGTSVKLTAPAGDFQFKFSVTGKDKTEILSRNAGNFQSDAAEIIVNVIEWLFRLGGYPNTADNETETFNAADFGSGAGPINWDVTTGSTSAVIIEADAVAVAPTGTINGATTVKVRYDNASTDATRAQTVKIQGTNTATGKVWFKRRTVLTAEWGAWPGGQGNTALNPFEEIKSADMGLAGSVDWDTGTGAVNGEIIQVDGAAHAGRTATGTTIRVRFDTVSPGPLSGQVALIKASNAAGAVALKARTIFRVVARAVNTSLPYHPSNALFQHPTAGLHNQTAGVVTPGVDGATWFQGKQEVIYDITPNNIVWSRRIVVFRYDDPTEPVVAANVKWECIARRDNQFTDAYQRAGTATRIHSTQVWANDGFADSGDFQFPTDAIADLMFRIDGPGVDPTSVLQFYYRDDFREFIEFHNGISWNRICEYAFWFVNLTGSLSGTGAPPAILVAGAVNTIGTGATAATIPNNRPIVHAPGDQLVAGGAAVSLLATATDQDNDVATTFIWTQTAGTTVIGAPFVGNPLNFAAPAGPTILTFQVVVDDSTRGLPRSAGDSQSVVDIVNINVI